MAPVVLGPHSTGGPQEMMKETPDIFSKVSKSDLVV